MTPIGDINIYKYKERFMNNKLVRFIEIPVTNLERASKFYESVFDLTFQNMEMSNAKLAMFCIASDQTNGALVQGDGYIPSKDGILIYLSAGDNMQLLIDRIPDSGGRMTMNRSSLEGHGFVARFIDTEGNKIGLHSEK